MSWRRADISSWLLQLSRLPFGLGHCVCRCVFCVRWVQSFGTCYDHQQGDSHPSMPIYRRWPFGFQPARQSTSSPAWRLQALHTSHSWVTFKQSTHGTGTGCLLHTSKYLQAQAPDDLNTLHQLASRCSQTHSQGVGPSPLLLPLPMPGPGLFPKQHQEEQAQHIPLILRAGPACHMQFENLSAPVWGHLVINLLAGINIHKPSTYFFLLLVRSQVFFFPTQCSCMQIISM